ncbi:MAG: class I SAM-dependent methyltransferase [Coriobacteriales bacterium]
MDERVAAYFDARADEWAKMERCTRSALQPAVTALAGIHQGSTVCDLGCGLGVMLPVYHDLGVRYVLGVDISPRMVELARQRNAGYPEASFVATDACDLVTDDRFDAVVVYNAYPHFLDHPALVKKVHELLVPEGRFVVAHSTGRDTINRHHEAVARGVSSGLGPAEDEAEVWRGLFDVDTVVDTPDFYAFAGIAR